VADPVAEAFKAAVMAVLDDASLDLAGKMAKIETILEQQEALAPASAAPAAFAQEQTLAEQVKRLTEQVATLTKAPKPKKYITAPVPEQTDTVPTALTDKAKMRKWLTS
jgi:phage tail sheath gpL-like